MPAGLAIPPLSAGRQPDRAARVPRPGGPVISAVQYRQRPTSGVYVITGGTRGIGAQVARELAGVPGRALVLGYRGNHERARDVVAELDCPDSPVRAMPCDVSERISKPVSTGLEKSMNPPLNVLNGGKLVSRAIRWRLAAALGARR
jgi:KR domain